MNEETTDDTPRLPPLDPDARESASPRGPLSPNALGLLIFSPTEYFQRVPYSLGMSWLIVAMLNGIASASHRIDNRVFGRTTEPADDFADPWMSYWFLVLFVGVLWALWHWWVGGWWYRMRLKWSGAKEADPRQARLVYTFSGLVASGPAVLHTLIMTIIHPTARAAWEAKSTLAVLVFVFSFGAIYVSWRGVLAVFPVRPTPALWWFAILPTSLYVIALGFVAVVSKMYDLG